MTNEIPPKVQRKELQTTASQDRFQSPVASTDAATTSNSDALHGMVPPLPGAKAEPSVSDDELSPVEGSPYVRKQQMRGMFDEFRKELDTSSASTVENLLAKYDKFTNKRIGKVENTVKAVEKRLDAGDTRYEKLEKRVTDMEALVAASDSKDRHEEYTTERDRDAPPILGRIRLNLKELASKEAVQIMAQDWTADCLDITACWELLGSHTSLSKSWSIQVLGDAGTAARRANKLLQLLVTKVPGQLPVWRQLWVNAPDGRQIEVSASLDKNQKQIQTEIGVKKLHKACKEVHKDINWGFNKRDGTVTSNWKLVCKFKPTSSKSFQLEWKPLMCDELKIDKEKIKETFNAMYGGHHDDSEWTL